MQLSQLPPVFLIKAVRSRLIHLTAYEARKELTVGSV